MLSRILNSISEQSSVLCFWVGMKIIIHFLSLAIFQMRMKSFLSRWQRNRKRIMQFIDFAKGNRKFNIDTHVRRIENEFVVTEFDVVNRIDWKWIIVRLILILTYIAILICNPDDCNSPNLRSFAWRTKLFETDLSEQNKSPKKQYYLIQDIECDRWIQNQNKLFLGIFANENKFWLKKIRNFHCNLSHALMKCELRIIAWYR